MYWYRIAFSNSTAPEPYWITPCQWKWQYIVQYFHTSSWKRSSPCCCATCTHLINHTFWFHCNFSKGWHDLESDQFIFNWYRCDCRTYELLWGRHHWYHNAQTISNNMWLWAPARASLLIPWHETQLWKPLLPYWRIFMHVIISYFQVFSGLDNEWIGDDITYCVM